MCTRRASGYGGGGSGGREELHGDNGDDEDVLILIQPKDISFSLAAQVWLMLVGIEVMHKENTPVSKFLNRLLGLDSKAQNLLFAVYCDLHDTIIRDFKRKGKHL